MLEMYVIWATSGNCKVYKFIRTIRHDDTFGDQINQFENDVRERIGYGGHIDMIFNQDAIEFEGTTVEYDWRMEARNA